MCRAAVTLAFCLGYANCWTFGLRWEPKSHSQAWSLGYKNLLGRSARGHVLGGFGCGNFLRHAGD